MHKALRVVAAIVATTLTSLIVFVPAPAQADSVPSAGWSKRGVVLSWYSWGDTKSVNIENTTNRAVRVAVYVNDQGKWNGYDTHTDGWQQLDSTIRVGRKDSATLTSWYVDMRAHAPRSVFRFRVLG